MAYSGDDKRAQLAALDGQLRAVLEPGLQKRLREPGWYLTGVKVGLESLHAFYEISELVYREHTARSEGSRRLARLRTVYEQLTRFARGGMDAAERARLMLDIRQPLQTLLHEFEFESDAGAGASGQRKTIIGQLASDIRLNLIRERSFEKLEADLKGLLGLWFLVARGARKKAAEKVRHDHIGYAEQLGFGNADQLMRNGVVKTAITRAQRERKKLVSKAELVHRKIFRGDGGSGGSDDLRADLAEQRIMPRLQAISRDGLEYLHRAESAYEHALQLVNGDVGLLRQVTALGIEIEDSEFSDETRRAKAGAPPLPA